MKPPSNPCTDHSYELPLRRNLLLLLDLLRFIAGVLLDRLGVVSCQSGGGELLQLPGLLTWGAGEHGADDAAMERFLEATLCAPTSSPATTGTARSRSRTAAVPYRRRRRVAQPEAAADDGEGGAAGCAICLVALEAGGCHQQTAVELGVCSHAFHAGCIDAWASCSGGEAATCPLCRAPMLPTVWDDGQSSCHARHDD